VVTGPCDARPQALVSASGKIQPSAYQYQRRWFGRVVNLAVNETSGDQRPVSPADRPRRSPRASTATRRRCKGLHVARPDRQSIVTARVQVRQAAEPQTAGSVGETAAVREERSRGDQRLSAARLGTAGARARRRRPGRARIAGSAQVSKAQIRLEQRSAPVAHRQHRLPGIQEGETAVVSTMNSAGQCADISRQCR
jgi:hypothetical protein